MTATRPAPTDAQVEALAQVLYEAAWYEHPLGHLPWGELTDLGKSWWLHLARAVLSSSVIGDLIAETLAPVCEALEGHALGMQDLDDTLAVIEETVATLSPTECGAWYGLGGDLGAAICHRPIGHPPISQDGIGHDPRPLPVTPADGTTSERSEA